MPPWLRQFLHHVKTLLFNRYSAFACGLIAYSILMRLIGGIGGLAFINDEGEFVYRKEYWELVLLFYLYAAFNAVLKPGRWQAVAAAIPLLLAYLGQDIYYLMYSNVFRMAELSEVPELFKVASFKFLVFIALAVVLPLAYFFWRIDYRKYGWIVLYSLPILALSAAIGWYPEQYLKTYRKVGREIVFWSDAASVENNGRFMMLFYREAERRAALRQTASFRDRGAYDAQAARRAEWLREHGGKQNIHLIVMESFVDPTLFKKAKYSKDPIHPTFRALFGAKQGFSISPVFGGKTSQAEFEILCGVPAFEELSGVEFNLFTGAAAHCLPSILQLAGYQSIASNAYKPNFFNTPNAYAGMGFQAMYFPREFSNDNSYIIKGDTSDEMLYMFDRELFQQNLTFVTPLINEKKSPLFNYLLTIYGHSPHPMNETKRPLVTRLITSFQDPQLERIANQFFYRSQALAEYLHALIELDKEAIIIVVSDHVPPTQGGLTTYKKLSYLNNSTGNLFMNRLLIIEGGKVKKYATIHHYDIPALILNVLSNGAYCQEKGCDFSQGKTPTRSSLHEAYMRLMAHATE